MMKPIFQWCPTILTFAYEKNKILKYGLVPAQNFQNPIHKTIELKNKILEKDS